MKNKIKKLLVSFICLLLGCIISLTTACSCAHKNDDSNLSSNENPSTSENYNSDENNDSSSDNNSPSINPSNPDNNEFEDYQNLNGTENFICELIYSDLLNQYDTFTGYISLNKLSRNAEPVEVYGMAYVDYDEGYIDEDGKTYFSAGFISFPDEISLNQANINSGLEIVPLEKKQDDLFSYVYSYTTEDIHRHCVIDNKYVKYDIVNDKIEYSEEPFYEGMNVDFTRGNIYNYDIDDYVYIVEEQDYIPISGVSLIGEADYQDIINEVNKIFQTQSANLTYSEIESYISQSKTALYSYLLGLQEESFMGIPTTELINIVRTINPMQHLRIGVDINGNTTIELIEITKLASTWEKIATSLICGFGVVGGFVCNAVGLPIIGGAIMGACMETFSQVVINKIPINDIEWTKIAVSTVAGAIAGGVAKAINGIVTNGIGQLIIKEAADTLCDSIIGGGEFFVNALIDGYSFEDACKNFGYGVIAGVIISGSIKIGTAIIKGGAKLIKKATSSTITDIGDKQLTKLSNESVEDGFSELQEKAIQKSAKDSAEDSMIDSLEELQNKANSVAHTYNKVKRVVEKANAKGITDIVETPNGGVSFKGSKYMYQLNDGTDAIVKIKATGNRASDFNLANKFFGFDKTPAGYVWHHLDDFDVNSGTFTLELVSREAHLAIVPHAGGCAQYDAIFGPSYNPLRKGVD